MRTALLMLACCCIAGIAYAQTGTIRGTVSSSDGQPAAAVTVHLKNTSQSTMAGEDGTFVLHNVSPGSHEIEVSLVGYEPVSKAVTVESGRTVYVSLQLKVSAKQLQEVVVTGSNSKFIVTSSHDVAKMPLKNLENPQVYTTVTNALMQDQLTVRYSDALKNVPGIIMQLENNIAGGTVTTRGFSVESYLRNGVPGIVSDVTVDPVNIERIEAIKGPSGTLYGSSLVSYGGLFNRVTKKPFDTFKGEIAYTIGGYGLSRLTADINTPLNKDKTLLFRLNSAIHHEGSYQDAGFASYVFVAPSLTYKLDDKTTLNVDGEYTNERANNFYRIFVDGSYATGVSSPRDLKMDFHRRFIPDDMVIAPTQANLFAQLDHRFSAQWHSRTNLSYLSGTESGNNGYMSMDPGNDSLSRILIHEDYYNSYATDIQQNFSGDFAWGSMRDRLLLGAEFYTSSNKSSSVYTVFDKLSAVDPGDEYGALTAAAFMDRIKNNAFSVSSSLQNTYSAYLQDVLNITPKLLAMASVRWDYFDNKGIKDNISDKASGAFHQSAFSPKFGLVYQLVKDKVSLFSNYMNGFSNNAPIQQPDGSTSSFKPSQANQWEGGLKVELYEGKLTGSISYYDIKVTDVLRQDYPARPQFTVQDGDQYSKGVEAELTANPFPGFNAVAGYAYNASKYEKVDPTIDGYRPSSAGPANMANLWLSYHLPQGTLKGLGIGFGGNYAGRNGVIVDQTDGYYLPAFTVLNASLSYSRPRYSLTCKLDNLSNQEYWVGWGTTIPQMPRRFSASLSMKF